MGGLFLVSSITKHGGCLFGSVLRKSLVCTVTGTRQFSVTVTRGKVQTMKQVEVDEVDIQKKLGKLQMDFVRKAEQTNKNRAKMHRFFRRKDWMIAAFCVFMVVGIYSYTIFAIKQEKFLDDFDMPEEINRIKEDKN